MASGRVDTATVKERIDLRELAGRYTTLHRASASEMAGPCPKCGGDDRFHVRSESFFCRACYPLGNKQPHDAIAFLRWLQPGLTFADAVAQLDPAGLATAPSPAGDKPKPAPARKAQPAEWQQGAEAHVRRCFERIWEGEGAEYLLRRALEPHTWLAFGLGFDPEAALPGTGGKQRAPAVVIPWRLSSGRLVAVRHRFLQVHTVTGEDDKQRDIKMASLTGSLFSGHLYGAQGICGAGEQQRTLVLCEGEFNALSVWQVAQHTGCDVLSVGSESQSLSDAMIKRLKQWRVVLTWADRPEVAEQLAGALPGAFAITSERAGGDANDLLKAGKLGEAVSYFRFAAASQAQDAQRALEMLLWDLYSGADTLQGLDSGSAKVYRLLAGKLGKGEPICEPEPDRWVAEVRVR